MSLVRMLEWVATGRVPAKQTLVPDTIDPPPLSTDERVSNNVPPPGLAYDTTISAVN